jgi:hypothetical protein
MVAGKGTTSVVPLKPRERWALAPEVLASDPGEIIYETSSSSEMLNIRVAFSLVVL